MQTAIVKATKEGLTTKLRMLGRGDLVAQAKMRFCNGLIAIQHPQIAGLSRDELMTVCQLAHIAFVDMKEMEPFT